VSDVADRFWLASSPPVIAARVHAGALEQAGFTGAAVEFGAMIVATPEKAALTPHPRSILNVGAEHRFSVTSRGQKCQAYSGSGTSR